MRDVTQSAVMATLGMWLVIGDKLMTIVMMMTKTVMEILIWIAVVIAVRLFYLRIRSHRKSKK